MAKFGRSMPPGKRTLHEFIMREAAVCSRMKPKRLRRVEKDPAGGWIARRRDGSVIPDADFRWNSRSAAKGAVLETDLLCPATPEGRADG